MKYILELNEKQMQAVKQALEEYFRIRINQWEDVARDLAKAGIGSFKETPGAFDLYLQRQEDTRAVLQTAMQIAQPKRKLGVVTPLSEEALMVRDLWQVIKYALFLTNPNNCGMAFCVDAHEPMPVSREPMPRCRWEEGKHG